MSTIIWSVPVPPLMVSRTVSDSVAKNVNVSSPVPPKTERLPAALAVTFSEVDNESPVAVEALMVDVAPGWILIPGLAAKKASLTVNVDPVVSARTSTFDILTISAVVNVAANSVDQVMNVDIKFNLSDYNLDPIIMNSVARSLEVTNQDAFTGTSTYPSVFELKHRIMSSYSSQNRAVTLQDYKSVQHYHFLN